MSGADADGDADADGMGPDGRGEAPADALAAVGCALAARVAFEGLVVLEVEAVEVEAGLPLHPVADPNSNSAYPIEHSDRILRPYTRCLFESS